VITLTGSNAGLPSLSYVDGSTDGFWFWGPFGFVLDKAVLFSDRAIIDSSFSFPPTGMLRDIASPCSGFLRFFSAFFCARGRCLSDELPPVTWVDDHQTSRDTHFSLTTRTVVYDSTLSATVRVVYLTHPRPPQDLPIEI